MSISERIRPNIEAAPWVCEEVGKLEASHEATKAALATANERIMELEAADAQHHRLHHAHSLGYAKLDKALAAEREVSDKLVAALEEIDEHPPFGGTRQAYIAWLRSVATKALAEVAAIRAKQQGAIDGLN